MTYYNLNKTQALHAASLKSGDEMVIVVPIEQPDDPMDTLRDIRQGSLTVFKSGFITKLPYPIGEIGLRSKNKTIALGTVTSARVDRVQEFATDCDTLWLAGFHYKDDPDTANPSAFIDWFNARYSKPRPIKKDGEIVGYRCWCWDDTNLEDKYWYDEYSTTGFLHKGKPLEVIVNGFTEIFTVRKE